ncbi:MAG: hypothetical protein WC234_01790, partial [Endomicrobiaceae bacterium]
MRRFLNRLGKVSFVIAIITLMSLVQQSFAAISGSNSSENYTYSSDSGTDNMYTSTMTGSGYSGVVLSTSTAVSLTAQGTGSRPTMTTWYNDTALNLSTSSAVINLNNISVSNSASLQASSLNIDNYSYLFSDSGS